jgi:hypothetical protein
MPFGCTFVTLIALTLGCVGSPLLAQPPARRGQSRDSLEARMRAPAEPYRMGPARPEWTGRAFVSGTTLVFEFPALEPNNVGCAAVDAVPPPARRQYYWLASADYPDSRYPRNHFQQVALSFTLAPSVAPTRTRLDSSFAAARVHVDEAAGEPPMTVRTVAPERSRATLERTAVAGRTAWRTRVVVEGQSAVRAFLSAGADSVSLGWCQRDQWLTSLHVPLERK